MIISALEPKQQAAWWPRPFKGKIEIALRGALAIGFVALALYALSGRQPPDEDSVDLVFPLRHGTYYVVAGGSNDLVNPHIRTLTGDRYAAYRGQSYGVVSSKSMPLACEPPAWPAIRENIRSSALLFTHHVREPLSAPKKG